MTTLYTATIHGAPRTKKNSQRIFYNKATGKRLVAPSAQYKEFEVTSLAQLRKPVQAIVEPSNVKCVYYMPTRRKVDLCNLIEATCDILVRAGVLADDNSDIVVSHDGSRVLYDKNYPRTEITITEAAE